ncbi:MAG: sulfatase family protein [Candidatus Eiseniibacteriota bacterium]
MIRVTLALSLASLLVGCAEPRRPPNLVLIVVDALRADALGCYGNPDGASPVLDALAVRGVQFQSCVAQAPWAVASLATILTGRYPSGHGANFPGRPIAPGVPLLAEAIAPSGRDAGAVAGIGLALAEHGLDRGFAWSDDFGAGDDVGAGRSGSAAADSVARAAADRVDSLGKRPFFLLMACSVGVPDPDAPPAERREHYREGVRAADRALGRLLHRLQRAGRLDDTIFLVTASRGEALGGYAQLPSSRNPHAEVLEVPLLVGAPGRVARELRTDPAMLVDVLPTVLQLLGQAPTRTAGRGLLGPNRSERPLYAEVVAPHANERCVALGGWKAVHDRLTGDWRLYDLTADPGETLDLAASRPDVLERLREAMPEPGTFDVSADESSAWLRAEEKSRLQRLSYPE